MESIQREKLALDAEAASMIAVAASGKQYANALDYARTRAELLAAAQQAGKAQTPELIAQVDQLAAAHTKAGAAAAKAADDLDKVQQRGERGAEALSGVFTSVLTGAKSAEEAVADLLLQIAQAQLNKAFVGMFSGTGIAEPTHLRLRCRAWSMSGLSLTSSTTARSCFRASSSTPRMPAFLVVSSRS